MTLFDVEILHVADSYPSIYMVPLNMQFLIYAFKQPQIA